MDIWKCALGFMDSQILLTAEELGVFDALAEGPQSAESLAEATNLPLDSMRRLLTVLCALELVERQEDGLYVNSPEAAEQLVSDTPGYIGSLFDHLRTVLYPSWGRFGEILQQRPKYDAHAEDGRPAPSMDVYSDPESLRAFMEGMHAVSYQTASEFAEQATELGDIDHVVDLGGASGAFLIALAQHFPNLQGTVFDLPQVRPIAEDFIRENDLDDRLSFVGGDFFNDPIPSGVDACSLGLILHDWNREQGSVLLEKVARALRPGGLLIISESLLNEDRTGPLHVARSDLNMMVAAQGRERTAREYEEWLGEFGFAMDQVYSTSLGRSYLMARLTGEPGTSIDLTEHTERMKLQE